MNTLPILLINPRILLLGGGQVAYQKAVILVDNKVSFEIKSRAFLAEFTQMNIEQTRGEIQQHDFTLYNIIVDATGNDTVGSMLQREKQQRYLLVNRVDSPSECDFYFSSLLNYGALKIAISTDGSSPTIGQVVRDKIKRLIPENIATIVDDMAILRQRGIINPANARTKTQLKLAKVYCISCGPGAVDLLTVHAYRCLQQLDIAIYDQHINPQILALIPESAQKVYLGKHPATSGFSLMEIDRLLLHYAVSGLCVGFLKIGNIVKHELPSASFKFFVENGVSVEVVPGLSAATVGAS